MSVSPRRAAAPIGVDARTRASIEAYDEAARAYQEEWQARRPRDAIRRFARLGTRGDLVLDVGCGPALDVRHLQDYGFRVVAGDRGGEVMRLAHLLHPKRPLGQWDFRQLPFADRTFGGIWAFASLQHLPRRELRSAFSELGRVHDHGPILASFRLGRGDLEQVEDPPAGEVHVTSLTEDELGALLLDQGYAEVDVERRPDPLERPDVTWIYGWGVRR